MIEMRWKQVVTRYHSPTPDHAIDLRAGGLPYVLQYRDTRGITGLADGDEVSIDGKVIEWQDVEIQDD